MCLGGQNWIESPEINERVTILENTQFKNLSFITKWDSIIV